MSNSNGNSNGNANGNDNGNGNGNGNAQCHVVPPGFVPPGLAKKCGQVEEPYPDMHPGGPTEGWEKQFKKKHWEFHYTNDVSLALPEPLQVTDKSQLSGSSDYYRWKQTYTYGAGGERLSMNYLPAYDANNGWDPKDGTAGAEPGVAPRTLYYLNDALGSAVGLIEKDGRVSSRYHYDEFGIPLDAKKFDVNWPGPDNLFGYTGLGYDYDSGLTNARARYYTPEIGRFISEDTYKGSLWNPRSQNGYAYVWNNPLKYIDPTGHDVCVGEGGCSRDYLAYYNPTNVSENLIDFIKQYEEFHSTIYRDADDKKTVGYGHVVLPGEDFSKGLTESEAIELLKEDLAKREEFVSYWASENSVPLNQQEFDALVSFVFNAGEKVLRNDYSTFAQLLISGDYTSEQLKTEFVDWSKGTINGKKQFLKGLYNRRMDEWEIFVYGDYNRDFFNIP